MFDIDVRANFKEFTRGLDRAQRRQVPFAASKALNATAFDAQRAVRRNIHKKYRLTNRFTEGGVQVERATKRDLTASVLMAANRAYMTIHETGGLRYPKRADHIAVPAAVKRTAKGRVTRSHRPSAALAKPGAFIGEVRGRKGIYQRKGKGSALVKLYHFVPHVTIKPTLGFGKTIQGVVRNRLSKNFSRAWDYAMRSAR